MGVYVVELPLTYFHQCPGGGSAAGGIPSERRNFRSLGQPECAPFEKFNLFLIIENHHPFALFLSVVSPDSHALIIRTILTDIVGLETESLLKSQNIRLYVLNHRYCRVLSVFPGIVTIVRHTHPDVE